MFISCPIPKSRNEDDDCRNGGEVGVVERKDNTSIVSMEENEIQKKRNTDCVYFLASPLTCNKGNECEFRHSETARLNPRDCWYWMGDNCLNPTCAFRHPPLEGYKEKTPSDPVPGPSLVPSSKVNVPCYFYFNSFCNKGDQCPFLHELGIPKTASNTTPIQLQEKKSSNESHRQLSSAEPTPNHSGSISKDVHESVPLENESKEFSPSTELSIPEIKSDNNDSVLDDAEFREDLASDKNSESVKDGLESDGYCDSSPGFDVIVGNESEPFSFDRNIDCRMGQDRDMNMVPYEYGISAGYDPLDYSTVDFLHEHAMQDSYDHFDCGYNPDYPHEMFEPSKEEDVLETESFHGRKIPQRENEIELCDPNDLRHRLLKNRRMDSCHLPPYENLSRQKCIVTFDRVSPQADLSNSRSAQGGAKTHRHGRGVVHRDHSKHSSRRQERETRKRTKHTRKHPLRSEISNDADIDEADVDIGCPQKRGGGEESRRNGFRNPTKSSLEFEGPKSLSELLKQKKNQQKRENVIDNGKKSSSVGYKRRFSDDIDDDEYSE